MTKLLDIVSSENPLPTSYATSVSSNSYISVPSSASSDLYPTSTVWPYCQGINPISSPAYVPTYTPWQIPSPFDRTGSVVPTPQLTNSSNIVPPYAQGNQQAYTGNFQGAAGSLGSLDFRLGQISDMHNYPSPGSSTSEQTTSHSVSVPPPNISPGIYSMPSPSVPDDTRSRQSSRKSQEPPRNAEGLLYCNHAEHAQQQPPAFSRKCEWRLVNLFCLSELDIRVR